MDKNLEREKLLFKSDIKSIENRNGIKVLLAYVRGSHMYGTSTDKSDVDITFVYQQPTDEILKGNYKEQINIGGDDIVGYEIQRFLDLLGNNNPNILEALDIPEDCMIFKDPLMDEVLVQSIWLSKLTEKTILGYAQSQVKKATGLHKNMNNPQPKKRKSILDFCYIIDEEKSTPFMDWYNNYVGDNQSLDNKYLSTDNWGLVKVPVGKGLYTLFLNEFEDDKFRGLIKDDMSSQLRLSEVPILDRNARKQVFSFYYNLDGFEVHCKQHKAYWEWMEERNEERHKVNENHGKNYDSKNMMHLFRLLDMAFSVAFEGKLITRTSDVEWLRQIRSGSIGYEELMGHVSELEAQIHILYELSDLQDSPDIEKKKELILKIRKS